MSHILGRSLGTPRGEELYSRDEELLGIFPSPEAATYYSQHLSRPEEFPFLPVPTAESLRDPSRFKPSLSDLARTAYGQKDITPQMARLLNRGYPADATFQYSFPVGLKRFRNLLRLLEMSQPKPAPAGLEALPDLPWQ